MKSEQHNLEIYQNRKAWEKKSILKIIYGEFYKIISQNLLQSFEESKNLEIGSGMGNIKNFVSNCLTSDIFTNPWLDRTENAYRINFTNDSLSNLILFDVWHHLEYPANALQEAWRVLEPGGRLIIFDPAMSLTGKFVYGIFHHEPLGLNVRFESKPVILQDIDSLPYFAAQSSAHRLLFRKEIPFLLDDWGIVKIERITAFAYLASGGFRGRQLYPDWSLPFVQIIDRFLSFWPDLFAARMLVVLEKKV